MRNRITAIRTSTAAELEKQLESDQKNAIILGRLCSMLRKENPAKAIAYCRRASDAEPSNMNHAVGFGAALVQAREFESAVGLFSENNLGCSRQRHGSGQPGDSVISAKAL
ncbi:MAG: hypothetical protein IPG58_09890 [Acidobacteria bacterium]|nr:hypothetical protein [Acidobacteriota bacterium]